MRVSGRYRLLLTSAGFILVQNLLFRVGPSSSFRVAPGGGRRAARALPRAVHVRRRRRWHSPEDFHASRQAAGLDQNSTPLVDALANAAKNVRSPLFYPGHKMGRRVPGSAECSVEYRVPGAEYLLHSQAGTYYIPGV